MVNPCKGRAWQSISAQVAATYGWTCHLCGEPIPRGLPLRHPLRFQVDHVKPKSIYPHLALTLSNLRPSHQRCNKYRGARTVTPELIAEIQARFTSARKAMNFFQ